MIIIRASQLSASVLLCPGHHVLPGFHRRLETSLLRVHHHHHEFLPFVGGGDQRLLVGLLLGSRDYVVLDLQEEESTNSVVVEALVVLGRSLNSQN
jgi:hypothetical protein